ncbi:hypothetical protein P43SY_006820 [Pythium insidiosum]|uniref:Uncharacterized protein n=1 Tax=Pythium insidiosum TaxID=114742 RepID=A0AAD5LIP8_PYTIN|nr:hypothetical protein P43SY_006820 [Pythium insidiosum]
MDLYILDTMTMVWTQPRVSSHVSSLTAPCERFLFDCCFAFETLVVFGGFTYSSDGAVESYQPREDNCCVYKLDLRRMIWRRQQHESQDDSTGAQAHYCCNNTLFHVVDTPDQESIPKAATMFTAATARHDSVLQLAALDLSMMPVATGDGSGSGSPH